MVSRHSWGMVWGRYAACRVTCTRKLAFTPKVCTLQACGLLASVLQPKIGPTAELLGRRDSQIVSMQKYLAAWLSDCCDARLLHSLAALLSSIAVYMTSSHLWVHDGHVTLCH